MDKLNELLSRYNSQSRQAEPAEGQINAKSDLCDLCDCCATSCICASICGNGDCC